MASQSKATKPADPAKGDMPFVEWVKADDESAFDFTKPVTADVTLKATYDNTVAVPAAATGLVYDGTAQTGVEAGTGYTLENNTGTNAGGYTAKLTLADGYKWPEPLPAGATLNPGDNTVTIPWTIAPKDLSTAFIEPVDPQQYTGSAITPKPAVTLGDKALRKDEDFTYEYKNNTKVGLATIIVEGKNNYTGKASTQFAINKQNADTNVKMAINPASYLYTSNAIEPQNVTLYD